MIDNELMEYITNKIEQNNNCLLEKVLSLLDIVSTENMNFVGVDTDTKTITMETTLDFSSKQYILFIQKLYQSKWISFLSSEFKPSKMGSIYLFHLTYDIK